MHHRGQHLPCSGIRTDPDQEPRRAGHDQGEASEMQQHKCRTQTEWPLGHMAERHVEEVRKGKSGRGKQQKRTATNQGHLFKKSCVYKYFEKAALLSFRPFPIGLNDPCQKLHSSLNLPYSSTDEKGLNKGWSQEILDQCFLVNISRDTELYNIFSAGIKGFVCKCLCFYEG